MQLKRPPGEIFFAPTLHDGLFYIDRPDWILRPAKGATVMLAAGSDIDTVQSDIRTANDRILSRLHDVVMEISVQPTLLEDATFRNCFVSIGGRYVMNGATGDRLRTKFDAHNRAAWRQDRLLDYFRRCRRRSDVSERPCAPPSRSQPIALELKNGGNFYHFLTETLGNLAFFLDDGSDQPIYLHHSGNELRKFVPAFVQAVYPELFPRVKFTDKRRKYAKVRSTYNHRHYLYQVNDPLIADALAAEEERGGWCALRPDVRALKRVRNNSFDTSQRLLREVALSRLDPELVASLPRRIYVDRAEGKGARARGVEGDAALLAELARRGFERVYFEKMTPLMQIASMQAADIMISPHGAGFANMLFARPDTLAIEIGTRQTQLHRWGDFLSVAHAAGCRYGTVFADVNTDDPTAVPSMADGHVGIRIGKRAVEAVLQMVDAYEPGSSKARNS